MSGEPDLRNWPDGLIRGAGDFVRADGVWYPTKRPIRHLGDAESLDVEAPVIDAPGIGSVRLPTIDAVARVTPTTSYRGVRFTVEGLLDSGDGWVQSPVPQTDARFRARLWALSADQDRAAALDGAVVEDARALLPGVWLTVPVSDLTDYDEHADVRTLSEFEEPDWPVIFAQWGSLQPLIEREIALRVERVRLGGDGLARFSPSLVGPTIGFERGTDQQTMFTLRFAPTHLDVATPDLDDLLYRVFEYWTAEQVRRHPQAGSAEALQLEYLEQIEPAWANRKRAG